MFTLPCWLNDFVLLCEKSTRKPPARPFPPSVSRQVTLTGQTGAIYSVAWSTDGERIASTSGEGTVWIWDAESGKAEHRLRLHSRAAHRVEWDPFNGTRLASASADRRSLTVCCIIVRNTAYIFVVNRYRSSSARCTPVLNASHLYAA